MKLGDLIERVADSSALSPGQRNRDVLDIVDDSRRVRQGSLFVAVRGFHTDGHQFMSEAIRKGAVAVLAENQDAGIPGTGSPVILVPDSRSALATVADLFYDHPSRKLKLIGITGTNGKTTTSYLVKSIIESAGHVSGLIGTIDYRIGTRVYAAPNTTPESLGLQKLLAEMVTAGAGYCVMEVSSHALALGRTEHCVFAAAGFTNLTQDHLDFHQDMDSYFRSKLRLFTGLAADKYAVINRDDPMGREIVNATPARVMTIGLSSEADVRPEGKIAHSVAGLSFSLRTPSGTVMVDSPLMGRHNIYNILLAAGIGIALGCNNDSIAGGIRNMRSVPGRMEKVDEGQAFGVLVDYAHTEDALARLLDAVHDVAPKRIITVFGCGGDRDRTKRPKMGAAALRGSDIVIVTSDNPRTEDPLAIIREIEAGMIARGRRVPAPGLHRTALAGRTPYLIIPDRGEAIEKAIQLAGPGDIIVLAGKGHEDYQIIGEKKLSFDDRQKAREAIRNMRRRVRAR